MVAKPSNNVDFKMVLTFQCKFGIIKRLVIENFWFYVVCALYGKWRRMVALSVLGSVRSR